MTTETTATRRTAPDVITGRWLRRRQACTGHVAVFEREWPDGAALNRANLRRAAALGLDLEWFARRVLDVEARAAYERATAEAWAAYERATAEAWAAYWRAAEPWVAYQRTLGDALADALGLPAEEGDDG